MLEPVPRGLVWLVPDGLGVDQVESRVRLKYNTVPEVEQWTWSVSMSRVRLGCITST